jgi:hypothetical protein
VHLRYEAAKDGKYLQSFFADWPTAKAYMDHFVVPEYRNFCEVLRDEHPCKPYLDVDVPENAPWPSYLPQGSPMDVAGFLAPIVKHVFQEDFDVRLHDSDLIWTHSEGTTKKLSIHLVICTRSPQVVFRSNRKTPHGAAHLAERLRSILNVAREDGTIDMTVYSLRRGMRMLGCTKRDKPGMMVPVFDDNPTFEASAISWLDPPDTRKVLEVPAKYINRIPEHVTKTGKGFATMSQAQVDRRKALVSDGGVVSKLLEEVQKHFHPTAFLCGTWAEEDPWGTGIRMNYTDRSEPCYSGKIHTCNNFSVRIRADNNVVACCFDPMCKNSGKRTMVISRLKAADLSPPLRPSNTTQVEMQYIDFEDTPQISQDGMWDVGKRHAILHDPATNKHIVSDKIRNAVDRWTEGKFKALCIKSPMGTGKSCFMTKLLGLLCRKSPGLKVLVITYRQTLAQELSKKLNTFHFQNYLDCEGCDLADQETYPRLILQLDSLPRIQGDSFKSPTKYDLVVLDEFDSLLRHFDSATIAQPRYLIDLFANVLRESTHVLCMDALFGEGCSRVLDSMGVSSHLIHNTFPTPQRRFVMTRDNESWLDSIANTVVIDKKRVVVPCMHLKMAMTIQECLVKAGVDPSRIAIHTSKDGQHQRKMLDDVDKNWAKVDVLIFTPCVEAGVDFSVPDHFHRMFVYIGVNSTSCWGLYQMTGRVRKLGDPTILCYADHAVASTATPRTFHVSFDDASHFLTWMVAKLPKEEEEAIIVHPIREPTSAQGVDGVEERMKLPVADPAFAVSSYIFACKINSKNRFLLELQNIVEESNHVFEMPTTVTQGNDDDDGDADDTPASKRWVVTVGDTEIDVMEIKSSFKDAAVLVNTPDFEREWDAEQALERRRTRDSLQEDANMLERHIYKQMWNVATITEDFVKNHSKFDYAKLVKFQDLLRNTSQLTINFHGDAKMTHQREWELLLPMISEVIVKLGLEGPLDDETVLHAANWVDLFNKRGLEKTAFFSDYSKCVKLSSDREFRGNQVLDASSNNTQVCNAINKNLLEKVGLNLQQEGRGNRHSYRLKGVDENMALLYLQYNRNWENKFRKLPAVLEYSKKHPDVMQRYMDLAPSPMFDEV